MHSSPDTDIDPNILYKIITPLVFVSTVFSTAGFLVGLFLRLVQRFNCNWELSTLNNSSIK